MPTYSANPDLLDALAASVEGLAESAEGHAAAAAMLCFGESYWSYGETVAGTATSTVAWAAGWAASLRQRAGLLRAHHEVGSLGAGAAGGAGPTLGAGYQWALHNGDRTLSFEEWYSDAAAFALHTRMAEVEATVLTMLADGAGTDGIAEYLLGQAGLTEQFVAEMLATAIAAELLAVDGPRGHALAAQLRTQLGRVLSDPDDAAAAFRLIVTGAPVNVALAVTTGDWSRVPGGDPARYSEADKRVVFGVLGIELPDELSPGDLVGIDEIMGALPHDLVAALFNIGWTYQGTAGAGLTTPGSLFLPARGSLTRQIGGEVSLSDVRIGPGFQYTHSVEISATYTGAARVYFGKSTLGKAYKALEVLSVFSTKAQQLITSSPWLQGIARGLPFSFEYTRFAGTELSYEATITTAQAAALADGDGSVLPDIFAPYDMAPGTSLLIRGGAIEGSAFAAKYKVLYLEDTHTDFTGLGLGVTALDDGKVAIYSGPIEAIEQQTFLGIKIGITAGLSADRELAWHHFAYAELDLTTPEGEAAYRTFVTGGGIPTTAIGTAVRPATIQVMDWSAETGVGFGLGSWNARWELGSVDTSRTWTTYDDGTATYEYLGQFTGSAALLTTSVLPDGTPTAEGATLTIVVDDVDKHTIGGLTAIFTGSMLSEEEFDDQALQLTLTDGDISELRSLAEAAARASLPDEEDYELMLDHPLAGMTFQLAAAETNEDVIEMIIDGLEFSPNGLIADIQMLGYDVAFDLHGGQWGDGVLPGALELGGVPR